MMISESINITKSIAVSIEVQHSKATTAKAVRNCLYCRITNRMVPSYEYRYLGLTECLCHFFLNCVESLVPVIWGQIKWIRNMNRVHVKIILIPY